MNRTTSKTLAAAPIAMALVLSLAACGQAPAGSIPQQVAVSTSETPPPPSTQDSAAAVAIALGRTGGGNVDEVENEFEHGRAAWKVRVVKDGIRYSVYIDKATGEIIRFRDEGKD